MSKALNVAFRASQAFNQNTTSSLAISAAGEFNGTEAQSQVTLQEAATYSNLIARVTANTLSGSATLRFRVNGANGNQVVTITTGLTGQFFDDVNTDICSIGQTVNMQLIAAAGGTSITLSSKGCSRNQTGKYVSTFACGQSSNYSSASTKNFVRIGGSAFLSATESPSASFRTKVAGTLRYLTVVVFTNGRSTATTCGIRKNAADGNILLSIAAGATGTFTDNINTDSVAVDDTLGRYVLGGGGAGNFNANQRTEFHTTGAVQAVSSNALVYSTGGSTLYEPIFGSPEAYGTEEHTKARITEACTATIAELHISANATITNTVLTLRKNGASTGLTVTVAGGGTGWFENTASVALAPGDDINWMIVTGGSGAMTIEHYGLRMNEIPSAGFHPKMIAGDVGASVPFRFGESPDQVFLRGTALAPSTGGTNAPPSPWFWKNRRRSR